VPGSSHRGRLLAVIYLADLGGNDLDVSTAGPWVELLELRPGLVLVESEESRSAVYHALKAALPRGSPLLVTELHEPPKMKGMAPGAVAWARARLDTGRSG
jgi:hypothetical protein